MDVNNPELAAAQQNYNPEKDQDLQELQEKLKEQLIELDQQVIQFAQRQEQKMVQEAAAGGSASSLNASSTT